MMTNFLDKFRVERNQVLGVRVIYMVLVAVSLWQVLGLETTPNNNFTIFKQAFFHLIEQKPLYVLYPAEHIDYYFYHPVFALLFAPFAVLPWQLGLILWVSVITFVLYIALQKLPLKSVLIQIITLLVLFELGKNIRHVQPNILNTGLMLLVFYCFEQKKMALGAFLCVLLFCIKGFGAVVAITLFFYPRPWRTVLYGICFTILLFLSPLLVTSLDRLLAHYQEWLAILQNPTIAEPDALISFFIKMTQNPAIETKIVMTGLVILILLWSLRFFNRHSDTALDRLDFTAFLLIWVVAFNRAAESPTYIHAVVGMLILWATAQNKAYKWVFMGSFAILMLAPSDLVPRAYRELIRIWSLKPIVLFLPLCAIIFKNFQSFLAKNITREN